MAHSDNEIAEPASTHADGVQLIARRVGATVLSTLFLFFQEDEREGKEERNRAFSSVCEALSGGGPSLNTLAA